MGADITNLKKENVLTIGINSKGQITAKLAGKVGPMELSVIAARAADILAKIGRAGTYVARNAPGSGYNFIIEKV